MFGLLTIFIGALVALQSRFNGRLATKLDNGIAAALLSNLVGITFLIVLVFGIQKERDGLTRVGAAWKRKEMKVWEFFGGLAGGFFLSIQSIAVPQVGVAIFTIATIGGQTISSLVVDKMGISPSGKKHITLARVVGASATLMAVTIAVYPQLVHSTFRFLPVALSIAVGVVVSFQQAVNGRVNAISLRPLATTMINFTTGTVVLTIALAINFLNGGRIAHLPSNPWMYLGGPLGLLFIAVSAYVVKALGVLNFILFSVTGQLIGALLLDWLAPTAKTGVSANLIYGTVLTLGSIAFSQYFERRTTLAS